MRAERLAAWLRRRLLPARRPPDVVVEKQGAPYLLRWHLIPRNPLCNVYLHAFLGSDPDAMHDHAWPSCSLMLVGAYLDESPDARGGSVFRYYSAGDLCWRWRPSKPHRIQLVVAAWTLLVTGPRLRRWGFHCPTGWIPWERGPGCD